MFRFHRVVFTLEIKLIKTVPPIKKIPYRASFVSIFRNDDLFYLVFCFYLYPFVNTPVYKQVVSWITFYCTRAFVFTFVFISFPTYRQIDLVRTGFFCLYMTSSLTIPRLSGSIRDLFYSKMEYLNHTQ